MGDSGNTTQLQVDTNGVTLPNATTGTAANGLCINASNQVITCSTGMSLPTSPRTELGVPSPPA
jgi:hypothetical protein